MTVLSKWDPLRELDDFSNRLSNLVGRNSNGKQEEGWFTRGEWAPPVDISEDDQEYLIKAEIAGVEKEQVKVSVENGVLIIAGNRQAEQIEKNQKYHRIERLYGNFIRTFSLPDDADGQKIQAEFKNGVLKVHLPKNEKAKPKHIEIKVS